MKQIAPGVEQFEFPWPYLINAYVIEDVVVDASTYWDRGRMLRQLRGRKIAAVTLTHAHPDHQGSAAAICKTFNVPLAVHEADVESAEGRAPLVRQNLFFEAVSNMIWAGKRCMVGRVLKEGDQIAGFRVVHAPGHTAGAMILFREHDGVALVGDVVNNNHPLIQCTPWLREPPAWFSVDPQQNRDSIRKLWKLGPKVICPGHGPPLRDMRKLERMVARLK